MNKFILLLTILILTTGCNAIWEPNINHAGDGNGSVPIIHIVWGNKASQSSDEDASATTEASRDFMPDAICDWVRIKSTPGNTSINCRDYALSYHFDSIPSLANQDIGETLPFNICKEKLPDLNQAKQELIRLLEYRQVNSLLYYASLPTDNLTERREPLELAMVYEFYLTNGSLETPRWWNWLTPEDQLWLEKKRPQIHKQWTNRFSEYPNMNQDTGPSCQRQSNYSRKPAVKSITKEIRRHDSNGRDCYKEIREQDFLGISKSLREDIGPPLPIIVCRENNNWVDVTGENVLGVIQSQGQLTQAYLTASTRVPVYRGEVESILIGLLAFEMYLRDGESDSPIWWDMLTTEDQAWINEHRQTIYDHWKVRLDTYK